MIICRVATVDAHRSTESTQPPKTRDGAFVEDQSVPIAYMDIRAITQFSLLGPAVVLYLKKEDRFVSAIEYNKEDDEVDGAT